MLSLQVLGQILLERFVEDAADVVAAWPQGFKAQQAIDEQNGASAGSRPDKEGLPGLLAASEGDR
eukprot:13487034-Alexandrium_andersonii.AAC.1